MLTYHESTWAVRRWDWFNEGRTAEPLSFCQFWRTVLLWATLRFLFSPLAALGRLFLRVPSIPVPRATRYVVLVPAEGGWLLLRYTARAVWFLAYPLRFAGKVAGGAALAGLVTVGKPTVAFGQAHEEGLKEVGIGVVCLVIACEVIVVALVIFIASWFWALVGIGGLVVGSLAVYGFIKGGALGLLWQAGVATHHGICPPVSIMRSPVTGTGL